MNSSISRIMLAVVLCGVQNNIQARTAFDKQVEIHNKLFEELKPHVASIRVVSWASRQGNNYVMNYRYVCPTMTIQILLKKYQEAYKDLDYKEWQYTFGEGTFIGFFAALCHKML